MYDYRNCKLKWFQTRNDEKIKISRTNNPRRQIHTKTIKKGEGETETNRNILTQYHEHWRIIKNRAITISATADHVGGRGIKDNIYRPESLLKIQTADNIFKKKSLTPSKPLLYMI